MRTKYILGCATSILLSTLAACSPKEKTVPPEDRTSFATRYAAAWSGKDPVKFGEFYDENGSLVVNGSASVGRAVVRLDSLREESGETMFHWTWTGTNTGPGGTGRAVHLSGYERWTIGANGLITKSDGHFDNDEYQRQLTGESPANR
jgi:hypothetical protein